MHNSDPLLSILVCFYRKEMYIFSANSCWNRTTKSKFLDWISDKCRNLDFIVFPFFFFLYFFFFSSYSYHFFFLFFFFIPPSLPSLLCFPFIFSFIFFFFTFRFSLLPPVLCFSCKYARVEQNNFPFFFKSPN